MFLHIDDTVLHFGAFIFQRSRGHWSLIRNMVTVFFNDSNIPVACLAQFSMLIPANPFEFKLFHCVLNDDGDEDEKDFYDSGGRRKEEGLPGSVPH